MQPSLKTPLWEVSKRCIFVKLCFAYLNFKSLLFDKIKSEFSAKPILAIMVESNIQIHGVFKRMVPRGIKIRALFEFYHTLLSADSLLAALQVIPLTDHYYYYYYYQHYL